MSEPPFTFGEEGALCDVAMCATIPVGVRSKQPLLAALACQLNFPDYFGHNWDAFEECVRDLSWLPAGRVMLKHADLPLINDLKNARIYLTILARAVGAKKSDDRLWVGFPIDLRDQISWLLRSAQRAP
jgi:hypothetical protein